MAGQSSCPCNKSAIHRVKKICITFLCFSLSIRKSMQSAGFMELRSFLSIQIRLRVSGFINRSSFLVPERLRSIAGKIRLSAIFRSRTSSILPVPLNSSKMTSSMDYRFQSAPWREWSDCRLPQYFWPLQKNASADAGHSLQHHRKEFFHWPGSRYYTLWPAA